MVVLFPNDPPLTKMSLSINEPETWAVVDENNKVVETFRLKIPADHYSNKLNGKNNVGIYKVKRIKPPKHF